MPTVNELKKSLSRRLIRKGSLRESVPASSLTTFGVGANVPLVIDCENVGELRIALYEAAQVGLRAKILGCGSNIVLPDGELCVPVIRLGSGFKIAKRVENNSFNDLDYILGKKEIPDANPCQVEEDERFLVCFGKVPLMSLSRDISAEGFSGLEYAAGIPGSVGGSIVMNAGAHGWDMGTIVEKVWTISADGSCNEYLKDELKFSYRECSIPKEQITIAALLKVVRAKKDEVLLRRSEGLEHRRKTQPLQFPSAGSAFRNPSCCTVAGNKVGELPSAGKLLDEVGLKGYRIGGVEYSKQHANWLIKVLPSAKTSDVIRLLEEGKRRVKDEFNIELEPEIKIW